ncbi:hypothetical protein C0989_005894 [Termitomyces sp. Mn162]|nr:hypothetical protein C0989_005894 [Termitomyces sp. Mn162]KAH0589411.1 hypothetical protein H2248_005168 [Termitomyces sp. 'cryptogamus']
MDVTALLAHILTQTRQNIDFLVAQKQISHDVANEILAKLPKPGSSVDALAKKTETLAISAPAPAAHTPAPTTPAYGQSSYSSPPYQPPSATGVAPVSASAPTLPPGVIYRAKALWNYNERGENPADLSFRGGDLIDVTAETNADWWTGRHNGKEGLFPANYVQRVASAPTANLAHNAHPPASVPPMQATYSPPSASAPYGTAPGYSSYNPPAAPGGYGPPSAYAPPGGYTPPGGYAPTGGYTGPPPPVQAYTPYASQPGYPPGSSDYNKDHKEGKDHQDKDKDHDKKKHKMGGLGETFATAAVGGVGFGAGSAIGSGIIDSIF